MALLGIIEVVGYLFFGRPQARDCDRCLGARGDHSGVRGRLEPPQCMSASANVSANEETFRRTVSGVTPI